MQGSRGAQAGRQARDVARRQTPESSLLAQVRLAVGADPRAVIWRNQSGYAEVNGRWMAFGLIAGAADLIGLVKPWGRFLALEVKSKTGRASKEQTQFLALVNRMGGVGRLVRSVEEAMAAVEQAALPAGADTPNRPSTTP